MTLAAATHSGFAPLDWLIVGLYLASMVATGLYFARKQKTADDYLLASHRIPAWAAAVSIVATSVSAATFLGAPEQAFTGNLTYLSMNLSALIAVIIVAIVFIPAFYRGNVATVYQFLGTRLGPAAARHAGLAFICGRLLASGARLYIAAIPVSLIIWNDLAPAHLIAAVAVLTTVAIAYTLLGGLSAVIWTEVPQAFLFVGAALVAIVMLLRAIPASTADIASTLSSALAPNGSHKLTVFDTRWDPTSDFSLWSSLLGLTLFNIAVYATDQDLAQRMLSCRTAIRGAWSAILSNIIGFVVALLFLIVGLLLWVFYTRADVMGSALPAPPDDDTRQIFLSYILAHVPAGLRGVMLAGLFAAAMSSIASSMGAIASTIVTDFIRPARRDLTDAAAVRASRIGVLAAGIALGAIASACVIWQHSASEKIIPFAMGVMLFAYTGLLAVFLAAALTKRGTSTSVAAALIAGAVAIAAMKFGPMLRVPMFVAHAADGALRPLSLGWQMTIGTALAFCICIIPPRRAQ